jgi:hypothetical protein
MVTQQKYETDAFEASEGKYDITGSLKDDDGNPLSNVDLAIKCEDDGSEYSATTDSDGNFLVENVGPGKYTVTLDSDDYEKTSEEHQVGESSNDDSDSSTDDSGNDASKDSSDESSNEQGSTDGSSENDDDSSTGGGQSDESDDGDTNSSGTESEDDSSS